MILRKNGYSWVGVQRNFFTQQECEEVIDLCQDSFKLDAFSHIIGDRSLHIKRFSKDLQEIRFKKRLLDLTNEYNKKTYQFDLIDEFTYFVNKYENDLEVSWHKDENETLQRIFDKEPANRVSVSIGLNTEYEGGEFELESWGGRTVRIDRGTAVIFCGHELHKAHPVHKGVRYSLTAWRKGNR